MASFPSILDALKGLLARKAAVLQWGANSVAAGVTTRYLFPCYEDLLAQTSPIQVRVTRDGVLANFYIQHGNPAGNGNPIVYTVRVNGAPTALTVSLASTGVTSSDTANEVEVAAGDLVDVEATKAASIGASPTNITSSLGFR